MKRTLIALLMVALATPIAAFAADAPIKVGGIFDITGATADVGKDYAQGCKDAAEYINAKGGVNGRPIELIANDYAYKIPEATALYKSYKDQGITVIQGWGTGDTNAMKGLVNKDQIVYISASYDSALTDPAQTPYNFFVGASYGDAIRAAMMYINDSWTDKTRRPKVAFIYPDHPYGKAPIPAGKEMAEKLGFTVGPDQFVPLSAVDAVSQLTALKEFAPDWAWIGGTSASAAVIIKDGAKLGLPTKFICNVWGLNENTIKLTAGAANDRAYGMAPYAWFGDDVPGMKVLTAAAKGKTYIASYVQGWSAMLVMWEALKRAKTLDGPGVKAALETLRDFDTGGLIVAPVTFTPADHRPNTTVGIKRVDKDGKPVTVKTIVVERKPEWLGK
jgi:branched-chain amino acid transport system substrate-binding protein